MLFQTHTDLFTTDSTTVYGNTLYNPNNKTGEFQFYSLWHANTPNKFTTLVKIQQNKQKQ